MRRALLALPLLLAALPAAAPAGAQDQQWIQRGTAQIQALDKVNARISILRAPVGAPTAYGTLTITVRACHARPEDDVPDAAAWIEVTDSLSPPDAGPVFRGWLFANAPAVNMVEHPVYDLRILSCE